MNVRIGGHGYVGRMAEVDAFEVRVVRDDEGEEPTIAVVRFDDAELRKLNAEGIVRLVVARLYAAIHLVQSEEESSDAIQV